MASRFLVNTSFLETSREPKIRAGQIESWFFGRPGKLVNSESWHVYQRVQQQARTKDFEGAGELLKQAIRIGKELVNEKASNATVLPDIATTQSEIGDTAGALLTLAEFSAIAHQYPGPEGNGLLLQLLGRAQAQVGDLVGALQTHEEMVQGSNSDIVLVVIAEEQAKQGLMADALQTVERISDVNLRSSTLRSAAIVRGKHGTLQDAIEAIDRIPDRGSRSEAMGALALEQAVVDNPAAALRRKEPSTLRMT